MCGFAQVMQMSQSRGENFTDWLDCYLMFTVVCVCVSVYFIELLLARILTDTLKMLLKGTMLLVGLSSLRGLLHRQTCLKLNRFLAQLHLLVSYSKLLNQNVFSYKIENMTFLSSPPGYWKWLIVTIRAFREGKGESETLKWVNTWCVCSSQLPTYCRELQPQVF